MSKGSRPRPFSVPLTELDARHEVIFGAKPKKEQYVPPSLPDNYYEEKKKTVEWQTQPKQGE